MASAPYYTLTEIDASSGQTTKTYTLSTNSKSISKTFESSDTNATNPGHSERSFHLGEISNTLTPSLNHNARAQTTVPSLPLLARLSNPIQAYLTTLFLPTGYPNTVTPDYTPYQIYDSLQAFASSIAGLLSSRAVLQSLNVIDSSTPSTSTATAATLLSVVQSTLSNLTTILFASYAAPRISADVKFYRFLADIVNDSAFVLDLLAPSLSREAVGLLIPGVGGLGGTMGIAGLLVCGGYALMRYDQRTDSRSWQWSSVWLWLVPVAMMWLLGMDGGAASQFVAGYAPSPRVIVLCLSSVLRAICGVAGGSSKAVLSAHFGRNNPENIGDLNAKDGSQETVVGLIGMWVGGVLVSRVEERTATWCWMIVLLGMHLWCNWEAVRSVRLRALNRQRAGLVCKEVVEKKDGWKDRIRFKEVGQRESVLGLWKAEASGAIWRIGVSVDEFVNAVDSSSRWPGESRSLGAGSPVLEVLSIFGDELYLLWVDRRTNKVTIALREGASPITHLKAWYHAVLMLRTVRGDSQHVACSLLKETLARANESWDEICQALREAGWDLNSTNLEDGKGSRLKVDKQSIHEYQTNV